MFLALLLGLPTAVAANPDEAARRADLLRRRLVEAARQYVDPSNERVGGLEGVQRLVVVPTATLAALLLLFRPPTALSAAALNSLSDIR